MAARWNAPPQLPSENRSERRRLIVIGVLSLLATLALGYALLARFADRVFARP